MIFVAAESIGRRGGVVEMIRKLSLPRKVLGFDYIICIYPVSSKCFALWIGEDRSYQSDYCVSNRKECNLC